VKSGGPFHSSTIQKETFAYYFNNKRHKRTIIT
jgi:hypothetical protein